MTPQEFIHQHLRRYYEDNRHDLDLPVAGGIHVAGGLNGPRRLQVPGMPYNRQLIVNPGRVYRVNYFFSRNNLDIIDDYIATVHPGLNEQYLNGNEVNLSPADEIYAMRGASGSIYIPGNYPFPNLQLLNRNNANDVALAEQGAQQMVESFSTLYHYLNAHL